MSFAKLKQKGTMQPVSPFVSGKKDLLKVVGEDERGRRTEREEGGRRREFEPNLGAYDAD